MDVSSSEYVAKDRMSLKLILLFVLTFFVLLIGFVIYSIFTSMFAKNTAEMAVPAQPEVVVIDPKLETELAKVLEYETEEDTTVVNNPFIDRGNISDIVAASGNVITTNPSQPGGTTPGSSESKGDKKVVSESSKPGQSKPASTVNTSGTTSGNSGGTTVVKLTTEDRLTIWRQSQYSINSNPNPEIFAIEDLIPVGLVSGGDQKKEIIFYSRAADRTLSFPIGTRFYDAWLTDVRDDGVVFRFDDVYNSTRLKSWGRSIKTRSG